MHIVIGKEYDMIRIMGQGFVIYVKDIYNFARILEHIQVTSASFDRSIQPDQFLINHLKAILNHK